MSATISSMCCGRPRQDVRAWSSAARRHRRGTRRDSASASVSMVSPVAAAPRMILSSMSVMFITQRHRVAAPAQVADEQVGEQERAEVADVGRPVDGRAARVDADPAGARAARTGASPRTACRAGGASSGAPRRVAIASAEIDRPAPSAPSRLPVEALTLTAAASSPSRAAIARAHRLEVGGEPRSRRDDRQVDAGRAPAGGLDPTPDLGASSVALSMPGGVRSSAGKRRPRSPSPAAPRRASATRMEDDVAVRMADQPRRTGDRDATEAAAARPARTGGCRDRSRSVVERGPAEQPSRAARGRPGASP